MTKRYLHKLLDRLDQDFAKIFNENKIDIMTALRREEDYVYNDAIPIVV